MSTYSDFLVDLFWEELLSFDGVVTLCRGCCDVLLAVRYRKMCWECVNES